MLSEIYLGEHWDGFATPWSSSRQQQCSVVFHKYKQKPVLSLWRPDFNTKIRYALCSQQPKRHRNQSDILNVVLALLYISKAMLFHWPTRTYFWKCRLENMLNSHNHMENNADTILLEALFTYKKYFE